MKSNNVLIVTIILSIILVISIYFRYRSYSWPGGLEAMGCLGSIVLMDTALLIFWFLKDKIINNLQKKNVTLGLGFGLLWTLEISINNLIQPGLPVRDYIDNIFWGIIALLILITATWDTFNTNKFLSGVKSGFWCATASGAIACLTALILVVFGMKYILVDPVNVKEWTQVKATENLSGMDVYFAYQTIAGAIMHLFVLGAIMGLILGSLGGLIGKTLRIFKNNVNSQ